MEKDNVCYLFSSVILALEIDPHDAKALYRRALALQKLDKIGPAFKDAKEALQILPGDK